ncbi:hypothetical protein IFM89_032517 [Coptis chinensis]|uniref:Serine hydrolase domain-containing protein n=1 Tax=Coptis chinensis TaxID=261450 RepID=A0A835IW23_9MAGN|nr:hypothetical protein IFM89_032517 [Coptis chinensis]
MEGGNEKKMKILCLHGFRASGSFSQKQISKWGSLRHGWYCYGTHRLCLGQPSNNLCIYKEVFLDGIFPAGGKSDIEGIFPPPYFEWFQFNGKEFTQYTNLDECVSYLCEYIVTKGPFDGLLGFCQGAVLAALLLGYQAQGKVLKDHPPFKLFISVSGIKFRDPSICDIAYKDPIRVRSVHFIGAKDWLKVPSEELAAAFKDPLIINHPQGHSVPRLGKPSFLLLQFIDCISILFLNFHPLKFEPLPLDNGHPPKQQWKQSSEAGRRPWLRRPFLKKELRTKNLICRGVIKPK